MRPCLTYATVSGWPPFVLSRVNVRHMPLFQGGRPSSCQGSMSDICHCFRVAALHPVKHLSAIYATVSGWPPFVLSSVHVRHKPLFQGDRPSSCQASMSNISHCFRVTALRPVKRPCPTYATVSGWPPFVLSSFHVRHMPLFQGGRPSSCQSSKSNIATVSGWRWLV